MYTTILYLNILHVFQRDVGLTLTDSLVLVAGNRSDVPHIEVRVWVKVWFRVCVRVWFRVCVTVWFRVCVRVWFRVCVRVWVRLRV